MHDAIFVLVTPFTVVCDSIGLEIKGLCRETSHKSFSFSRWHFVILMMKPNASIQQAKGSDVLFVNDKKRRHSQLSTLMIICSVCILWMDYILTTPKEC